MNETIEVLGSGCPTCKRLHEITVRAAKELGLTAKVEYVTDVQRIVSLGLMQSPVLAVNGRPVLVGFTPDIDRVKKAIHDNL